MKLYRYALGWSPTTSLYITVLKRQELGKEAIHLCCLKQIHLILKSNMDRREAQYRSTRIGRTGNQFLVISVCYLINSLY